MRVMYLVVTIVVDGMLRVCYEGDKIRCVSLDGVVIPIDDKDRLGAVLDAIITVGGGIGCRLSGGMARRL